MVSVTKRVVWVRVDKDGAAEMMANHAMTLSPLAKLMKKCG